MTDQSRTWGIAYMAGTPAGRFRRFRTFRSGSEARAFHDDVVAGGEPIMSIERRVNGEWQKAGVDQLPASDPDRLPARKATVIRLASRRRHPTAADGPNRHGIRRIA